MLVDKHRGLAEQRRVLDAKRQDAVQFGRDAAAQHYAVEVSCCGPLLREAIDMIYD